MINRSIRIIVQISKSILITETTTKATKTTSPIILSPAATILKRSYSKLSSSSFVSIIKISPQLASTFIFTTPTKASIHFDSKEQNQNHHSFQMNTQVQIADRELRDKAHKICCEHLGGAWNDITPNDMSFTPISGGMSNLLYCCSLPESIQLSNGEPSQVLLRLYGDQSRNCDMSIQVQIFKLLSLKELGPKLYGDFDDGRLEEFLPAQSLTCEELMDHDISCIIAKKLASIHSLDVPIERSRTWILEKFQEWHQFIRENSSPPPQLSDGFRESTIAIANELMSVDFNKEIKFLRKVFDGTRSPLVFSHNDLHQGNILLARPSKRRPILEKRIILIDFEYCSYNYRAYDIANHFCEWCFEYDTPEYPHFTCFEDRFPSKSIQREFIRNYIEQQKLAVHNSSTPHHGTTISSYLRTQGDKDNHHTQTKIINGSNEINSNGRSKTNSNRLINGLAADHDQPLENGQAQIGHRATNGSLMATDEEIDAILSEVKPFCMAANLVWTLWCIKSAQSSNIKFGYWEHAMTRWRLYSSFKRSYLREALMPAKIINCNTHYNSTNNNNNTQYMSRT